MSKYFDERSSACTVSIVMKTRAFPLVIGSMVLAASLQAGLFPQGLVDHSLCCGTGPMAAAARSGDAGPAGAGQVVLALPVAPESAVTAPEAVQAKPVGEPEKENGYLKLGFDRLSGFKFVPPQFDPVADPKAHPPTGEEQIPAQVKSWSGKKALVTGFMQPTKLEKGKCTEFILMANQMACCFGAIPNINDWVIVRIPQGVPVVMDVPVSFFGTLKVGAAFENGYLTGIYELAGEKMAEIKG